MQNNNRPINLYTQGLQFAARVVLIVELLFGCCLASLLANPEDQGASENALVVSPATLNPVLDKLDKTVWEQYFDPVGEEPRLPDGIEAILNSPCPFWGGRQVKDTHLLALIPSHVGGQPLTLDYLRELIKFPQRGGYGTKYEFYGDVIREAIGNQSPGKSYWVLMTRDVLDESRSKSYEAQCKLVLDHANRTGLAYEVPGALEAAVVMLLHHARSGERLYSDNPWTYTRCRDKGTNDYPVVVGGFSSGGLSVISDVYDISHFGVAGLRKF